jgi:hypothetical protein
LRQLIFLLAGLSVLLAGISAYIDPYRLAGRLDEAQIPVHITGGDTLHLTPPVAEFVSRLLVHAYQTPPDAKDERPFIFDLTGQLPVSVYLLNGQAPGAAWFLDAFGSKFSQTVFASLEDRSFLNGWVLVRLDTTGDIDRTAPHFVSFVERINGIGKEFDQTYRKVVVLRVPYWGSSNEEFSIALYKPTVKTSAAVPVH